MGEIDQNGGAYPDELAYLNCTIFRWGMSPNSLGVLVKFDFPNYSFFLTYLLTYLKVINPQISGIAAAIITKLYGPNASTLRSKIFQFGRNRRMSNTTSGPKCSTVSQKR